MVDRMIYTETFINTIEQDGQYHTIRYGVYWQHLSINLWSTDRLIRVYIMRQHG